MGLKQLIVYKKLTRAKVTSLQELPLVNTLYETLPVTECKPIKRHFSCWSSRFHKTKWEGILINRLINRSDHCNWSLVFISRMIFMAQWGENSDCSAILKRSWKINSFARKTIRRTFGDIHFTKVLFYRLCCKKYTNHNRVQPVGDTFLSL